MKVLRQHWFDIGIVLAILILIFLASSKADVWGFQFLLWLNLVTLFVHQFEEYRFPGYFPGMVNSVMYHSKQPDRYPLNSNTSLIINVFLGWTVYALAAIFYDKVIWLAIATILVSLGNFVAHTFIFNLKGKTLYNPGLLTSVFLFLPMVCYFFYFIIHHQLATTLDYILGIALGAVLNVVGILKLIDWLKDEKTRYVFEERQLRPIDRKE